MAMAIWDMWAGILRGAGLKFIGKLEEEAREGPGPSRKSLLSGYDNLGKDTGP